MDNYFQICIIALLQHEPASGFQIDDGKIEHSQIHQWRIVNLERTPSKHSTVQLRPANLTLIQHVMADFYQKDNHHLDEPKIMQNFNTLITKYFHCSKLNNFNFLYSTTYCLFYICQHSENYIQSFR